MGLPQLKEERLFTYADYKEWELDEGERYELMYGQAFLMAGPNIRHQGILGELFGQFHVYLQGKPCKVFPAPFDVRLFYEEDENDDTVVQPDILIVCDKEKLALESCRGAPDLVVEILSLSNTAMEMELKLKLYRQAGVREYWVVDPKNNGLTVYHFLKDKIITHTYGSADTVQVGIFPDLNINLEQIFAE